MPMAMLQMKYCQATVRLIKKFKTKRAKFVEKDKVPAVLDPMMAVHLKLLSVQSMATVNVLLTNLEILNVVQGLEIHHQITQVERLKVMKTKSVEKDRVLAVLALMMAVHLKLLSVQNGVIVNVLNINLGIQNVVLDFLAKKHQEGVDQAGKANLRKAN